MSSADFFGPRDANTQITARSNPETDTANNYIANSTQTTQLQKAPAAPKPIPAARLCPQTGADDNDGYLVKSIQFGYLPVRIVTQEGDGPCSLIAIANALLLRGTISLPDGEMWISHANLLRILRDYALNVNRLPADASDEVRANVHANMRAGLKVLFSPTMRKGMMCNPTLTNAQKFEFTPEIGLFDLFRIRPVHGWVVEPEDSPCIHEFFKGRSYDQVQDAISHLLCGDIDDTEVYQPHEDEPSGTNDDDNNDSSTPIQRSNREGTAEQAALASAWLMQHSTQMTETGVIELEKTVRKNEIAVLFRNNHFSTVIKHDDGKLYTLMSATAFLEFPAYVWQRVAVHGRDFGVFNGSFIPLEQ